MNGCDTPCFWHRETHKSTKWPAIQKHSKAFKSLFLSAFFLRCFVKQEITHPDHVQLIILSMMRFLVLITCSSLSCQWWDFSSWSRAARYLVNDEISRPYHVQLVILSMTRFLVLITCSSLSCQWWNFSSWSRAARYLVNDEISHPDHVQLVILSKTRFLVLVTWSSSSK